MVVGLSTEQVEQLRKDRPEAYSLRNDKVLATLDAVAKRAYWDGYDAGKTDQIRSKVMKGELGTCENLDHDSKPQEWHERNATCIDWHPSKDRPVFGGVVIQDDHEVCEREIARLRAALKDSK